MLPLAGPRSQGENGDRDAFETLMGVLRGRLVKMGLGTADEMRGWEGTDEHHAALGAWWKARGIVGSPSDELKSAAAAGRSAAGGGATAVSYGAGREQNVGDRHHDSLQERRARRRALLLQFGTKLLAEEKRSDNR